MLERDTQGDQKVEVAWSPGSRHVVIVENGIRDSAITAAWKDEVWHKTIEVDHAPIRKEGDRLIAEHRKFVWLAASPRDTLQVTEPLGEQLGFDLQ